MDKKEQEFEAAIKPLNKWLWKYADPHTIVIAQQHWADVYQGSFGMPLEDLNLKLRGTDKRV